MKIVVDVYGADNSPHAIVEGCVKAVNEDKDIKLVLTGYEDKIKDELKKYNYNPSQIEVVNADEVVSNDDDPSSVLRSKKNSSLAVAFNLLKEDNDIEAMVSAGSTGAVLTGGYMLIKRIPGVLRPALVPLLPTKTHKRFCIVDCGANSDCKPEYLAQFALMGSLYMKAMFGIENPRVALLSNGVEDKKGNELTQAAFPLLKEMPVNFVGNMEAREAMSGNYDVVVADGFSGNILLKSIEGTAGTVMKMLKEAIMSSTSAKIGALFMKKAFNSLKNEMDYHSFGAAPLLGINKVLVKAHGSASADAIKIAVFQVKRMVQEKLVDNIRTGVSAGVTSETAE